MISIVIPVLNEQKALPATLEALIGQAGLFEVIIVDSGSEDGTLDVAEKYKAHFQQFHIIQAPRGRSSQMNAGAALASGDWLLFLHADSCLQPGSLEEIENTSAIESTKTIESTNKKGPIQAGAFTHQFSGKHWGLKLISSLHNWRFKKTKVIYGDQAMFVHRNLFMALDGFPEGQMEDIRFSELLITKTTPILLSQPVVTDSRKFEQLGVWKALWYVILILLRYEKGRPVNCSNFFINYR